MPTYTEIEGQYNIAYRRLVATYASAGDILYWIAKGLGVFGLADIAIPFYKVAATFYGHMILNIQRLIATGNFLRAAFAVIDLIMAVFQNKNSRRMLFKMLAGAHKRILAKLTARFVPILGWALVAAEIAWAIVENIRKK